MTKQILKNDWAPLLQAEFNKDYYIQLRQFLMEEYKTKTIYPSMYDIFNALHYTPYENVKVVILGQDPYHVPKQTRRLICFQQAVIKIPPSFFNILKDIDADLNVPTP